MRLQSMFVAILLIAGASFFSTATALACSCLPKTIEQSDPFDGASDVSLNQAIVIEGFLDAASLKLEDASGNEVPFELNHGPMNIGCPRNWSELIPKLPLAAMTKYTVRASPFSGTTYTSDRMSTSFTTGTSLLPEETLTKPKGHASLLQRIQLPNDLCGPTRIKGCIGLEPGGDLEMVARQGDDVILRMQLRRLHDQFTFKVLPDCVEFRQRSRTGQRSEPLTICGDALATRDFQESDLDGDALACHDGVFGRLEEESTPADDADDEADDATTRAPSTDGCAMRPTRGTPWSALLMMLLTCAALARTRRRR